MRRFLRQGCAGRGGELDELLEMEREREEDEGEDEDEERKDSISTLRSTAMKERLVPKLN